MDNWASFSEMHSSNILENCQSAMTKHFDEIIVVRAQRPGSENCQSVVKKHFNEIIVVRARGLGGDPGHPHCGDEPRI